MEYSKEAILDSKYREVNYVKKTANWTNKIRKKLKESKDMTFILVISLLCIMLIIVDVVMLYNFVNIMQNML